MTSTPQFEPVRWGILGAASIALRNVIPAMQQGVECKVVAIASRNATKARDAATALGIPRFHLSYEALLEDDDVEAVYIPLPNHLHVPWAIRAAERGKHVLCEKPIALNAAEAQLLIDAREKYGVVIAEAFMVRTHPQWIEAKRIARSGRIGDVRFVSGHFSYFRRDPGDVRSNPEWGGGALLDIGCYPTTMTRWILEEEPTEVVAQLEFDPDFHVDRLGSALLKFPSGQAVFAFAGQLSLHQGVQIFGTKGRIAVPVPFNPPPDRDSRIFVDDGRDLIGGGAEEIVFPAVNQFALQAQRFAGAVRGVNTVAVTLEDSVSNMRVLDAFFRSARSRAWESVAGQ